IRLLGGLRQCSTSRGGFAGQRHTQHGRRVPKRPRRVRSHKRLRRFWFPHLSLRPQEPFPGGASPRSKQRPVELPEKPLCLTGAQVVASERAEPLLVDCTQSFAQLAEWLI